MLQPPWNKMAASFSGQPNRWTRDYEKLLCYLVRGSGLYFELEVVK